jgi:D-alanyl-D-alanine carboxypeptidase/D-alanyl-D-alanine-endopeptidase (penicillin-binding protein 4)
MMENVAAIAQWVKRVSLPVGIGLMMPLGFSAQAVAGLCPAQLATQLDAALDQPPLDTSYTGLVLQTQGPNPRTIYSRNGDRLFTPASNIKLLTTAATLHRLGPDYRIRTSVYGTPGPGDSTTLRVVGRGDPTITDEQLNALARQVADTGVNQVLRLVVDDAYFPGFATNPTWEWSDAQWAYAAPVNSLILHRNAVPLQLSPTQVGRPLSLVWPQPLPAGPLPVVNDSTTAIAGAAASVSLWRTGDNPTLRITGQMAQGDGPRRLNLAVLNPAQQFAAALESAFRGQAVPVGQTVISQNSAPITDAELAALESPPLAELVLWANRDSDNLSAEVLLKTLGVTTGDNVTEASRAGGEAVALALADLGIDATALRLRDGSGLSRHNLVSPDVLAATLQAMATHPQAAVFRRSLAIAGQSGTLRNRLSDTALAGRVQGKSGALTGNVSLSGYMQPPGYDPLVFSILINHSNQPASLLRSKIDELLLLVAQLSGEC